MITSVAGHYGASDIVERILAAVPWSRDTGMALAPEQLYPFDQLHGREILATKDHAARLNPECGAHLLDIGSGVGGPARYFARTFGCTVTGIDLTPDFIVAARTLGDLCELDGRLAFVNGDACAMPFDDDAFDHAYSFYVGMNLPDKSAVLREAFRVLKPGGRLLWTQVTEVGGDPYYPLPWARTAEGSHIETPATLAALFAAAGFEVHCAEDETGAHLDLVRQIKMSGQGPRPGQTQANEVVLGADFAERRANYIRSLADGCIASTFIDARKPG